MIPPITREEKYMYEIVGAGKTAPEKPLTRKEIFYAVILGEDRTVPRPITNEEKYLAALAGTYSETLPFPTTRIEKFLAKAAGMDVETPVPVTREEIFWDNYSAVQKFEGVPPLTFKSNGKALKNYRIYGQTVDSESVGDLVSDGDHAGEYRVPVTVNDIITNLYLPEQIKKVGDEAEYIDYAEQKQHRVRKNLLENTATSQTINGVTFTVNNDGSVTCNGTATGNAFLVLKTIPNFGGTCILTGCPLNGSTGTYCIQYSNMSTGAYNDIGSGVRINNYGSIEYPNARVHIKISAGYTCDNLTFYPMIRKADIEDDTYEPYIENTEVDVTLPALPTIAGTNILSVDTQVQPSKVYVEGNIKTV